MLSGFQFPHGLLSLTPPPKKDGLKRLLIQSNRQSTTRKDNIFFTLFEQKRNTLCKQTDIKQQKIGVDFWDGDIELLILLLIFVHNCFSLHNNYSRSRIPDVTKNSYWKGGFFHYQTNTQINTSNEPEEVTYRCSWICVQKSIKSAYWLFILLPMDDPYCNLNCICRPFFWVTKMMLLGVAQVGRSFPF